MSDEKEVVALVERVVAIANSILQGETDADAGARQLWVIRSTVSALEEDLRVFVGLASEYEDVPEARQRYERDIIVAADQLRARWGP